MSKDIKAKWDGSGLEELTTGALTEFKVALTAATARAIKKASSTALRDMRSEASKRVRQRKRIPVRYIHKAIKMRRTASEVSLDVSGEPVPLTAYPHRQTKKGVTVEVNKGKRTLVKGSFKATMQSGHQGVFKRKGKARLPIKELMGSRPVDALLHKGEADAVAERGNESFNDTFNRVLPLEIGK